MRPQVLVVEDDAALRRSLLLTLDDEGFGVLEAANGQQALAQIAQFPDAVVLDLGLPDVDGVELCARLRELTPAPILVHSVRKAHDDLVRTLDAGADDYLTKPFPVAELAGELRALLLRSAPVPARLDRLGLDQHGHGTARDGARVTLTSTELQILFELASRVGVVVSRVTLLERVWGLPPVGGPAVLDARVRSLGGKLERVGWAWTSRTEAGYSLQV